MKLSYYCKSCQKKSFYKTITKDRFELQNEVGDELSLRCDKCGTINKKHINRLSAEPNRIYLYIALVVAILLAVLFWDLGFISKLTFSVPIFLFFDAEKRASNYNKTMVSRK